MVLLEIPIPRRVWGHPPRETLTLHKVASEASFTSSVGLYREAQLIRKLQFNSLVWGSLTLTPIKPM